mmetsp:Transcript_80543/g.228170  ORF Transcript_80543/g.228170 Transcript_80543/m.228170 type:complete len:253 (-) Transcript_80543:1369-2127(-)
MRSRDFLPAQLLQQLVLRGHGEQEQAAPHAKDRFGSDPAFDHGAVGRQRVAAERHVQLREHAPRGARHPDLELVRGPAVRPRERLLHVQVRLLAAPEGDRGPGGPRGRVLHRPPGAGEDHVLPQAHDERRVQRHPLQLLVRPAAVRPRRGRLQPGDHRLHLRRAVWRGYDVPQRRQPARAVPGGGHDSKGGRHPHQSAQGGQDGGGEIRQGGEGGEEERNRGGRRAPRALQLLRDRQGEAPVADEELHCMPG